MNKVKWLLLTFVFILSAYDSAFACSCIGPADAKEGLVKAKAVFSGKVIAMDGADATFKVEREWKGVTKSEIVVRDYYSGTSCAFDFKLGERYVVFATTVDYEGQTILIGEVCNWTVRLANEEDILKAIGKGKPVKRAKTRTKAHPTGKASDIFTSSRSLTTACTRPESAYLSSLACVVSRLCAGG